MHHKLILGAVAACACLGVAAPAGAATIPVPLQFNHAVLDTSATPKAQVVKPSDPIQVTANVDPATGQFTVQPSDWHWPTATIKKPVPATISVSLKNPATGTVDPATGQLSMTADLLATITIPGQGSCVKDTGPLTLTTDTKKPLAGVRFPAGQTGFVTGDGAFGAEWQSLQPGTGSGCQLVDAATAGPGGLWVSRGISPVPPAVKLGNKSLKPATAGSRAVIRATVKNTGGDDTAPIKVCLASPKGLSPKSSCQTIKSLKANATKTLSFKIKTSKTKTGSFKLKLTATGSSIKKATHSVTLKVRK